MERSEYVENRLLRIGATPEYVGYPYLLDSILLVWDKPEAGRNITTQVYPSSDCPAMGCKRGQRRAEHPHPDRRPMAGSGPAGIGTTFRTGL